MLLSQQYMLPGTNMSADVYDSLVALAHEKSSDQRRTLLSGLTDMFLDNDDNLSDKESTLFADVMCRVLDQVEVVARAELAGRVADSPNTPTAVASKLARDEDISVAEPILRSSPVLSDDDLVEIARSQSQDHLLAMSARETLSEAVTDVLVDRGDNRVLETVSGNEGASFSQHGMTQLIEHARSNPEVRTALQNRSDLDTNMQASLTRILEESLKERLKDVDGADIVSEIAKNAASMLEEELNSARNDRIGAKIILQEVKSGKRDLGQALEELSTENRFGDVGIVLAGYCDLPEKMVLSAMLKEDPGPFMVICRANGIAQKRFAEIARLRSRRVGGDEADVLMMLDKYQKIATYAAERTFRFLKVRLGADSGEAA